MSCDIIQYDRNYSAVMILSNSNGAHEENGNFPREAPTRYDDNEAALQPTLPPYSVNDPLMQPLSNHTLNNSQYQQRDLSLGRPSITNSTDVTNYKIVTCPCRFILVLLIILLMIIVAIIFFYLFFLLCNYETSYKLKKSHPIPSLRSYVFFWEPIKEE